jgi:CheY-like chemotaxis protein
MQEPRHPRSTAPHLILVVVDDPELRKIVQWMLEDAGYRVLLARSASMILTVCSAGRASVP